MPATERIEIQGHIVDSLILAKVLDLILAADGDYTVVEVNIGRTRTDPSRAVIDVTTSDEPALNRLLERLQVHGANRLVHADATLVPADHDGVLPEGFYSTTNLPTSMRIDGRWQSVANPEMDCALVLAAGGPRTVPMHRIRKGDLVAVGYEGVRVESLPRVAGESSFEFMASEVSSEKPKGLLVRQVAERVRACRERRDKVLVVCGPAVVHTGASFDLAVLVREGWVDVLFAGNGFATHDMETNVLGTSLGITVDAGLPTEHGHSNHLRVINEIRRRGSIAAAVDDGYLTGGVMYECVRRGVPFVLAGSLRDDGPLPDVRLNVVDAADAMRDLVPGVGVTLMLASTLHAIATGNILPAGVETFCVDINPAVATKLTDRGSHQSIGIVTDIGLFVRELTAELT